MNRLSGKMLLLIELSILLVFFSFSVAVCSYLFVTAKNTADNAYSLNRAVTQTISIVETLKSSGGNLYNTGVLLDDNQDSSKDFEIAENILTIYYDETFTPVAPTKKSVIKYKATISKDDLENYCSCNIIISKYRSNEIIYNLSFKTLKEAVDEDTIR